MKIKLHTSVIYAGVMWPVGFELPIRDEDAVAMLNYGTPVEEKTVENGEKSCVEPPVADTDENEQVNTPSKKRRSTKGK